MARPGKLLDPGFRTVVDRGSNSSTGRPVWGGEGGEGAKSESSMKCIAGGELTKT